MHLPAAGKCQSTPDDIAMPDGLPAFAVFVCFKKKVPLHSFLSIFFYILFLLSLCILIVSCSVSACACCSI